MTPPTTVPTTVAELTADWLTSALRAAGVAVDVTAVTATVIGAELGFTGVVSRLELSYRPPGAGPATIVAKLPTAERARAAESGFRRRTAGDPAARRRFTARARTELRFYREIATSGASPAPRLIHGAAGENGAVVLLLEDVTGARQPDLLAGLPEIDARAVLRAMAPLHARWWRAAPAWLPVWLPDPGERARRFRGAAEAFLVRHANELPVGVGRLVSTLADELLPALAVLGSAPATVIHGDLHADNVVVTDRAAGREPRAVVLDWQTAAAGPAVIDVNTLLVGSMAIDERRRAESRLLEHYHRRLAAAGVAGYGLDRLRADYRASTTWHLARTVSWLASVRAADLAGRERLILEAQMSDPRVFVAALDHTR